MTPRTCRITVAGVLSDRFDDTFRPLVLERGAGTTALVGEVRDSAALYGVLGRLQDLGIDLIAVDSRPAPRAGRH